MLRHLPFFEALAAIEEGTPLWRATTAGLGVLRLVDAATTEGRAWTSANRWSIHATRTAAEAMDPAPARTVLLGLVELVADGGAAEPDLLAGRLFAYARTLDLDARYDLAADVYTTVAALADPALQGDIVIDAYMRLGYCHRMLGRFDDATVAYAVARQLAGAAGDTVKVLRGRVAEGNLALMRGNLPAASAIFEAVAAAADGEALREVRVAALHDRAAVAYRAGEYEEAVRVAYRALEGTRAPIARDRLLADIAAMFVALGAHATARDALLVLTATAQEQYTRWHAEINLLDLAARDGAELLFEQHRRQLAAAPLPVDQAVDFHLTAGDGYQLLGQPGKAAQSLQAACDLASQHQLHQQRFRAEAALEALAQGQPVHPPASAEVPASLRPISAAISELRELAGVG